MKYTRYIIAFLIILVGVEIVLLFESTSAATKSNNTNALSSPANEEMSSTTYWVERMNDMGGKEAYTYFVTENNKVALSARHANAHTFGAALFEARGLDGVHVCGTEFSYGCYHEYLGRAIHAHGIEAVKPLNEACFETLGGQGLSCQHGIGHGVLSYFGYEPDVLEPALEICRDLPYSDPIGGCYGGVFMEYNLRTMLLIDGIGPRQLESGMSVFESCEDLPGEYQGSCYYWIPQWWLTTVEGESESAYDTLGGYCSTLDEELRRKCFEGIGNIIPKSANYDTNRVIMLCQTAARDDRDELFCRADAANSFHVIPHVEDDGPKVCVGLTDGREKYCLKHSYNEFNQTNAPPTVE